MRGAPPGSAPMHYLRTHAGQGSADRQGRWQTGGRGTPRLSLLRQFSRRWEEFIWKKGGKTNPDFDRFPSGGKVRMDPTQPVKPSTFDDPLHKTAG